MVPQATIKVVKVSIGKKSGVVVNLNDIPVRFKKLSARLNFFVLYEIMFDIFIVRLTLERLEIFLKFHKEEARLSYRDKHATLPMISAHPRPRKNTGQTDSEDFTDILSSVAVSSGEKIIDNMSIVWTK